MAERRQRGVKSARGGAIASRRNSNGEHAGPAEREEWIATIKSAAGIILAVTENRNWIEVFFDGVIMHTETVNLPAGKLFNIYVEEIAHKTTIYEHPRTMIYFDGPYDLRVTREGERVIVSGTPNARES